MKEERMRKVYVQVKVDAGLKLTGSSASSRPLNRNAVVRETGTPSWFEGSAKSSTLSAMVPLLATTSGAGL